MPAGWVEGGLAVAGAAEGIAANQSAASATKQNNAAASQQQSAQGSMLNQAETVAQQPFQAYTGTLTAPMSGNEQQGYGLAASTAAGGAAQGDNAAAVGQINDVANNAWSPTTAATYMNPYTSAVTDAALAQQNKSYLQSLSGIQAQSAQNDALGGGRAAIEQGDLAASNALNAGSLTANLNSTAYNNAISTWQNDNQTKLNAANAYEAAGQDVTQMNSTQIADLMKTGGVSQVIAQTDLNNQYQQFTRQQGWSANQLQSLINANSSAKGSSAQVTPAVQSNTANQLLGLGSTLAGLFGGSSSAGGWAPTVNNSAPSSGFTNSIDPNLTSPSFNSNPAIAGGGTGSGGSGELGIAYSDYGLKKDLEPLYFDAVSHLPVYLFHYRTEEATAPPWAGYLAQDVQQGFPGAVSRGPKGYLMVDHRRVPSSRAYPMRVLSAADWAELDARARA